MLRPLNQIILTVLWLVNYTVLTLLWVLKKPHHSDIILVA